MSQLTNISPLMQDALTKLCLGYPPAALPKQPVYGLRKRAILVGDCIDPEIRRHWMQYAGIEGRPKVNPYWVTIDSLTDRQIKALDSIAENDGQRRNGNSVKVCLQKGLVNKIRNGHYDLLPQVAEIWPDWKSENQDRMLKAVDPRAPRSAVWNQPLSLDDLTPENRRKYERLSHPGQRAQVQNFALWENSDPQVFNTAVAAYINICTSSKGKTEQWEVAA
ncbi:MAG: hypothetical protein ACFB2W_00990 [Leptolyngbyaceae cyanobacterium]